ncbi:MAG: hypothetical protein ACR2PW_04610 [Gammaproteobacteria bacterium]
MSESAPLFMKVRSGGLFPVDSKGLEKMGRFADGVIVRILPPTQPRNIGHHRKYWALCQLIADNSQVENAELVSDVLKVKTGHSHFVETKSGEGLTFPKSISFAAMDQGAFDDFWDSCVKYVVTELLPGVQRADLEREIEDMIR